MWKAFLSVSICRSIIVGKRITYGVRMPRLASSIDRVCRSTGGQPGAVNTNWPCSLVRKKSRPQRSMP